MYLDENVKIKKVAQNVALGYFVATKNHKNLAKVAQVA
jgi:hypothetical protein